MDSQGITVRELAREELPLMLPLIERHNSKVDPEELRRRLEVMISFGYHGIGAFDGSCLVGVAGYWLGARFYCGEYMDVDNVVVDETLRSRGVGQKLMDWLHARARELGCKVVVLDSYVTFARAHKFYFRQDYEILGYHFSRKA
ncbi:MAG TPA: GNAT family N-acetyltransferase [Verrucomicrobiaceae bacterium]|jgi:GNAT superfamily N-acetyltransferase